MVSVNSGRGDSRRRHRGARTNRALRELERIDFPTTPHGRAHSHHSCSSSLSVDRLVGFSQRSNHHLPLLSGQHLGHSQTLGMGQEIRRGIHPRHDCTRNFFHPLAQPSRYRVLSVRYLGRKSGDLFYPEQPDRLAKEPSLFIWPSCQSRGAL